jgi:hypothetical protein
VLVPHGKAAELREIALAKPFQRVQHRREGSAGVSPPLVDGSTAASLPTEWGEKREVEGGKRQLALLCRVARALRSHDAVSWWPPHSPDTHHVADRNDNDRSEQHRPRARCHRVRGDEPSDRGGNQQGTGWYRLVEE